MATTCLIGIKIDDKVESIYCHWDGYAKGKDSVGQILKKNYTEQEKILKLIELGDLSSLGTEPVEDINGWKLDNLTNLRNSNKCVTYRSRGDGDVSKHISESVRDYRRYADCLDVDYVYLYKDGHWKVSNRSRKDNLAEKRFKKV